MEILQLILFQVVTFVVIVIVLRFLFGSQLRAALNRLQALHQESLEKEEILNKEIEKARIQAKNEIERSEQEARAIVDNAKKEAEVAAQETILATQAQAEKMVQEAVEKTRRLEAEVMATVEKRALEFSVKLIQETFTAKGQEALHRQLIDELIDELTKVDRERLAVKVDRAEIVTSAELSPQEKEKIKKVLSAKLGFDVPLDESVDPSLIIGMMIKLGGLVADGSLRNKLSRAMAGLHAKSEKNNSSSGTGE
ncbi:ATP synthase F0 sector subunit b [Candidatus Velamenicoccus archaeovorus]|uniref:Multifunctional fusion protein n=1 Tax=Velamenicoccus archaeovorus TaxID=1930593 RepID=A0A410P6E8_VELA1|nr:F0F1 ATP synthase subunit delta [Candidatus Velamenicoccus archaeovorus]QAT17755.1 ATP synthase F0 sector subunit b [Candidatus Velamenicoccus archaeovorus]